MDNEKDLSMQCNHKCKHKCGHGMACGSYGLGFIGALVYFIQGATSFWIGVVGVFKALFWPAFLVYKLLGFLGM